MQIRMSDSSDTCGRMPYLERKRCGFKNILIRVDGASEYLGVDHLIFDGGGGCANPPKNIEHMFLVKKKFLAEFLRRKKKSSSLNLGVAKDFA